MGSKQRAYDAEFREGAVRIVIETGKPIPEVAEELGVNPGTLRAALAALTGPVDPGWNGAADLHGGAAGVRRRQ
ncbi:transposase [Streptomyces sp. NPDC014892]|uniref:transposase n=1 Tax=Streptomyces sp. NPDC014892 TaxID=3364930 RepID=UPI0036FB2106